MQRAPLWALLGLALVADGLPACNTSCDKESEAARPYSGGQLVGSVCNEYETNGFDQPYIPFPAGRRWQIQHQLGTLPTEIKSYVSFVERPLPAGKNGNTAESAGNQVIIEAVTDESVQVRNDTCEEFYLRLVVRSGNAACSADGAGGAPPTDQAGAGGS